MTSPQLWLVRHAQSVWNAEGRLQGQTDHVPLTELGMTQAHQAAARLQAEVAAPVVWSSDLLRAQQTAEVIAAQFDVEVVLEPRLREQGLGELEGRLVSELHPEPTPVGTHISEVNWGGGESIAQVYQRCTALLADLPRQVDLILVSHGDTLRVLLAALAGVGHRNVEWREIGSAEVVGPLALPTTLEVPA